MKAMSLVFAFAALSAAAAEKPIASSASVPLSDSRVGVYDSRVVAYAFFWSAPETQRRDAALAAAKQARAAKVPDAPAKAAAMKDAQKRNHLQVFSTAPVPEALAALQEKLPAIQKELGVTRLVSRWDADALKDVPETNRVDVTDRLVREFNLAPDKLKMIESIKTAKPLPLAEAERLADAGKL